MIQEQLPLIQREANQYVISQRAFDGYVNATSICKACNKSLNDYTRTKQTSEFLEELSHDTGISVSELVQVIKGGNPSLQGTWVHPQVAINLGQWASPQFAVLVSKWVFEWMNGTSKHKYEMPYHIRRYLINREKIPPTHFSMLDQMTIRLLASLEQQNYIIPAKIMPDISLGKMFCKWLRDNGYEPDNFPTYEHVFDDGARRPVQAKLYPNELMTAFNIELNNWIRTKALKYLGERDENSIPALQAILQALPSPKPN